MTVDLPPGVYKIECLVEGHDDRGMEGFLEVRAGAPLAKRRSSERDGVAIENFDFSPRRVVVPAGSQVTWRNDDSTEHTVTSLDDVFDSDALGSGESFSFRFDKPGTYRYRCAIHPDMQAAVEVE
jgi:plastocyanin